MRVKYRGQNNIFAIIIMMIIIKIKSKRAQWRLKLQPCVAIRLVHVPKGYLPRLQRSIDALENSQNFTTHPRAVVFIKKKPFQG